jgi:chromosome partitioning protein
MGDVIAVYAQKGGTGKTTTTAALGEYFSQVKGWPVLMIDLDGQRSLSAVYDVSGDGGTILDVLNHGASMRSVAREVAPNLFLAPAGAGLYEWDYNEAGVKALGDALKGMRDWLVLIDCGPSFTALSKTALAASTALISPCQPSTNDVLALSQFLSTLDTMAEDGIAPRVLGVVLTRVKPLTKLHRQAFAILAGSPFHIFSTKISESVEVQAAADEGKSIVTYNRHHKTAREYCALGEEVAVCLA